MFWLVFILPEAGNVNMQLNWQVEGINSHLPDDLLTNKHCSTGPLIWHTSSGYNYYKEICLNLYKCTICFILHVDGLVQERRNSSALAMKLRISCTNSLQPHAGTENKNLLLD